MEVAGFISTIPANKHSAGKSALESLPQDILIKIVCGVDHDDLRALFHVSKTVQEATLIAKKLHFEYSTPKKNLGFRKNIYLQDDFGEFNEVVVAPPNAPRQIRVGRSRLIGKKLADISVALFRSDDDGGAVKWQRSGQILQMATQV